MRDFGVPTILAARSGSCGLSARTTDVTVNKSAQDKMVASGLRSTIGTCLQEWGRLEIGLWFKRQGWRSPRVSHQIRISPTFRANPAQSRVILRIRRNPDGRFFSIISLMTFGKRCDRKTGIFSRPPLAA